MGLHVARTRPEERASSSNLMLGRCRPLGHEIGNVPGRAWSCCWRRDEARKCRTWKLCQICFHQPRTSEQMCRVLPWPMFVARLPVRCAITQFSVTSQNRGRHSDTCHTLLQNGEVLWYDRSQCPLHSADMGPIMSHACQEQKHRSQTGPRDLTAQTLLLLLLTLLLLRC